MKPTYDATPSELRRYDRTETAPHGVSDDRARMLLGLPVPATAQVSRQPRAFVATEPSRASCRPGAVVTRSHRHHAESEA
jgi:hypothetical protein